LYLKNIKIYFFIFIKVFLLFLKILYIQTSNHSSDIEAPILNINKSTISQRRNKDMLNFIKHIDIDNIIIKISKTLENNISKKLKLSTS
jgi:hypothetical protein